MLSYMIKIELRFKIVLYESTVGQSNIWSAAVKLRQLGIIFKAC